MKGIEIKKKLQENGYSLKNIAELIGETPQNLNSLLNAQDIKTGIVERLAKAINKNVYFFYKDFPELIDDKITIDSNKTVNSSLKTNPPKSQREKDLELTIKVQQELIDSLKNRLRQYEEGVQDVGVAGVG